MSEPNPPNPPSSLADHDLLRRFVRDADEIAFEEIVRRHQRLVMSVCRRVVGGNGDADDAFQAVFLVLARRPRSIRRARSLSSWLYTVAWRASHRLVRLRRKKSMETLTQPTPSDDPDPLDQIAAEQHANVLHEELSLLPERYREVLVMSYFSQHTSQQIADQLQLTRGVVDHRIRQARNMLRVRLARRGVALGVLAVVSAAMNSAEAAAAVTPNLLESTIRLGTQTMTGTVPGTVDTSHLETLIRPETTLMNLKLVSAVGACLAVVVAGTAGMAQLGESAAAGSSATSAPRINAASSESPPSAGEVSAATSDFVTSAIAISSSDEQPVPIATSASGPITAERTDKIPSNVVEPRDRWLHSMMHQPIPALEFRGETPLAEILDYLADHYTETHGRADEFRWTVWPDDTTLQLENIDSLDDVIVSDIRLEGLPLRQALELIFEKTTDPPLTWDIRHGVFEVTTVAALQSDPEYRVTRTYPIGRIPNVEDLIRDHLKTREIYLVEDGESRASDLGTEYGAISQFEGSLVVTHHRMAQEAVAEFLRTISAIQPAVSSAGRPSTTAAGYGTTPSVPAVAVSRRRSSAADRDRAAAQAGFLRFSDTSIVVNLNDERMARYLSLNFAVQVEPALVERTRQRLDEQAPALRSWLISYLSDLPIKEVRGAANQRNVKLAIQEQFSGMLFPNGDGQLIDVVFLEFAVQ